MLLVTDGASALARDRRVGAPLLAEIGDRVDAELRVDGPRAALAPVVGALRDGERDFVTAGSAGMSSIVASAAWRCGLLDDVRIVHVGGPGADTWSRAADLASEPATRWQRGRDAGGRELTLLRLEHAAESGALLGVSLAAGGGRALAELLSEDGGAGTLALARRASGALQQLAGASVEALGLALPDAADVPEASVLVASSNALGVGPVRLLAAPERGLSVLVGSLGTSELRRRGPTALRDALTGLTRRDMAAMSGRISAAATLDGVEVMSGVDAAFRLDAGPRVRVCG